MKIRVYYEDTDCGGVVYYANYLKYFERARTELLRDRGVSLVELKDSGITFVVTKADVEYIRPCKYNDVLLLDTQVSGITGATMTFSHSIGVDGAGGEAARGTVTLAAVGPAGSPVRVPKEVRQALETRH